MSTSFTGKIKLQAVTIVDGENRNYKCLAGTSIIGTNNSVEVPIEAYGKICETLSENQAKTMVVSGELSNGSGNLGLNIKRIESVEQATLDQDKLNLATNTLNSIDTSKLTKTQIKTQLDEALEILTTI